MDILDTIIADKKQELLLEKQKVSIGMLERDPVFNRQTISLRDRLAGSSMGGIIAEFKRKSPSRGMINENADPTVRYDMDKAMNKIAPENEPFYQHIFEGADDMPAHIKTVLTGASVTIPVTNGKLNMGTWQGIYLGEFRNRGGRRRLIITVYS